MKDYELRVIPGCPNGEAALKLFRLALAAEVNSFEQLRVRVVRTEEEAMELGFQGSPSFIAGGRDLFPVTSDAALSCRIYPGPGGLAGLPSAESLRSAVHGEQ